MKHAEICFCCSRLGGCQFWSDQRGKLVPSPILELVQDPPCWNYAGEAQLLTRKKLRALVGIESCLHVTHQLPILLGRKENMDEMIDPNPDFDAMLHKGITTKEREDQFRFEHENGKIWLDKDGQPRTRGDFIIRRYACDPKGHIGLDHVKALGWTLDEIVQHCLRKEVELGLITKKGKEKDMPIGKKVMTKKLTGKPGPKPVAGASKIGTPPRRGPGRPRKDGSDPIPSAAKAAAKAAEASESAGSNDPAVLEQVSVLREELAAVKTLIEGLITASNEGLEKVADLSQKNLDAVAVMHDLHVDTHGTFHYTNDEGEEEPLSKVAEEPDGILSYFNTGEGGEEQSE